MAQQFTLPRQVKINVAGRPYAGAQAFFYQTGTETLQTVYQDADLATPHPQPVAADDDGYFPVIWLNTASQFDYRVVVLSANGSLLEDISPVPRKPFSSDDISTTLDSLVRTPDEIAAGVTPVNYAYPPEHGWRYGCVGDDATDNTTALQDLLKVLRQSGGRGYLPAGIYRYASTLAFDTASMGLYGDSALDTVLKKVGNFTGIAVTAACSLQKFTLDRTGTDTSAGITIRSQARVDFRDLIVQNQGLHGIWLQQASISYFSNLQSIGNSGDGVRLDASVAPVDSNSYITACEFISIDVRGNSGVGFHFFKTAFSNFCRGIKSQNNTGHGIKLDNARGNEVGGYAENNGGDPWHLTSDPECLGNEIKSFEGSVVDNSPSGGIYNTIWLSNRAGQYSHHARRVTALAFALPENGPDGTAYQGTLVGTHIANRDYAYTADGFSGSQTVRFRNAQSGGIDFLTDRIEVDTVRLKAAAPTVSASQIGIGSTTSSTVGAAGGATALPANPTGYWIINVAGTNFKVPYYAAS